MAQATKSRSKSTASRNGSQAKSSSSRASSTKSRASATKRSTTRRNSSRGSNRSRSSGSPRSGSQSRSGNGSVMDTAIDRTKAAGHAVAEAASKAKTPLIAGGTAIAGAAVGVAVKDRLGSSSKGPLKRLRDAKPAATLGKVDLDTVKSFGDRMSTYGRQASDIAEAVEKTRKKNK
jgi:hypothetical protein